jgi:hypothetical protein
MKKFIYLYTLLAFSVNITNAQRSAQPDFEWDIARFGFAIPANVGEISQGMSFGTEARYNCKDDFSIGIRYETAIYATAEFGKRFQIGASNSTVLIGDYYFQTTSSKRAFVGLGLGLYNGASTEVKCINFDGGGGHAFGISPRLGYKFDRLRLSTEYNIAFEKAIAHYFSFNIGITLFGK